jgi:hypothetical protein
MKTAQGLILPQSSFTNTRSRCHPSLCLQWSTEVIHSLALLQLFFVVGFEQQEGE